jgi:hypothetical protein
VREPDTAGKGFTDGVLDVLVSSPLLVAHARGSGGSRGRRIRIGTLGERFAVSVEHGARAPSITEYATASAAVHAYNAQLRRARRDRLNSDPEPTELTVQTLERALQARASASTHDRQDASLDDVITRERALQDRDVRGSPPALRKLLHPDFVEFGASGKSWDRDGIIATLAADPGTPEDPVEVSDMQARRLAPAVVLVTYRARRGHKRSLRSSLWLHADGAWQMLFHQGTPSGD